MMQEKKEIELHLSKLFLNQAFSGQVDNDYILFGNDLKKEPDILYKNLGIEIGAVLKEKNQHIDKFEDEFLLKVNNESFSSAGKVLSTKTE